MYSNVHSKVYMQGELKQSIRNIKLFLPLNLRISLPSYRVGGNNKLHHFTVFITTRQRTDYWTTHFTANYRIPVEFSIACWIAQTCIQFGQQGNTSIQVLWLLQCRLLSIHIAQKSLGLETRTLYPIISYLFLVFSKERQRWILEYQFCSVFCGKYLLHVIQKSFLKEQKENFK